MGVRDWLAKNVLGVTPEAPVLWSEPGQRGRAFTVSELIKADRTSAGKMTDLSQSGARPAAISNMSVIAQAPVQQVLYDAESRPSYGWFGPGAPLRPIAPPDVAGRQLDYPVYYNVNLQPRAYEPVSFSMLRGFADGYDLLRLVIETRKDQLEAFEWEIIPKDDEDTPKDSEIDETTAFFEKPDGEHFWPQWLRMMLEDLLVIDAVALYPRMNRGGKLYGLELVDGATIARKLDADGRTPLPPDTAFQQVLKGLPAVDYKIWTGTHAGDELVYAVRNPRTSRVYGYSPVEQVLATVNIALRRQLTQLEYFTQGNVPQAIAGVPDGWSMDTIKQFQAWWDNLTSGEGSAKRRLYFMPGGNNIKELRPDPLKDVFDEWLARIICFAFSIPPTALIREINRATAQTSQDTALNEGLIPLLNWLRVFFNSLLAGPMGKPHLQFRWQMKKENKLLDQAQADQIYLGEGVYDINEVRERMGLDQLTPAEIEERKPAPPPPLKLTPGAPPSVDGESGAKSGQPPKAVAPPKAEAQATK